MAAGEGPFTDVRGSRARPAPTPVSLVGAGGVELSMGFQGVITDMRAASRELRLAAETISLAAGRDARFGRIGLPSADSAWVERNVRNFTASAAQGVVDAATHDVPIQPPLPAPPPGGTSTPQQVMPSGAMPTREQPLPDGVSEGIPRQRRVQEAVSGVQAYEGVKNYLGGTKLSLGNIRRDVAQGLGRHLSQWGPNLSYDLDETGNVLRARNAETGRFASHQEIRRDMLIGGVKEMIRDVGQGEGIGHSLLNVVPIGVARAAGVGALAVTAGGLALTEMAKQRQLNAQWQSMLGGSQASAFGERARSTMFGIGEGLFGGLGRGQAEELYRGAAEIGGTQGALRGRVQDFGADMYRSFGMPVAESLKLVDTAVKSGVESFDALRGSLKAVSDDARAAGENVGVYRQMFSQSFQQASAFAPLQAAQMAQGQTQARIGLGQAFEGIDMSGTTGPQQIMLQARAANMTDLQYRVRSNDPQNGALFSARTRDRVNASTAQRLLQRGGLDAVRSVIADLGGREGLREALKTAGGRQRLQEEISQRAPNLNIDAIISAFRDTTGVALTEDTALPYLAEQVAGTYSEGASVARSLRRSMPPAGNLDTGKGQSRLASTLTGALGITGQEGLTEGSLRHMIHAVHDKGWKPHYVGNWREDSDTAKQMYVQNVATSGSRSRIIESLLRETPNGKFLVDTGKGQRAVGIGEAVRYFSDQLARGDVEIVGGKNAGQTVSDFTKIGGADISITSDRSHGDAGKAYKGSGDSTNGKVIIAPTPELERFFRMIPSGSAELADSRKGMRQPSPYQPGLD